MGKNNQQSNSNPDKYKKGLNNYAKYSGIAFQMALIIFGGVFGGLKLDQYLNNSFPIFLLIGCFLGVGLGIYVAIKDFLKS